jgi:hypothetical protein
MNKEEKKKLEEILKQGKWNYVLTYGGRYALLMFIFFWFFTKFIFEEEFYVTLNIIIWGIAGLVFGLWGWKKINDKSKKVK